MGGNDLRDTLPCDLDMGWHREESPATDGRNLAWLGKIFAES
jgi:hypothetical protein